MPKIIDYGHASKICIGLTFNQSEELMPLCYAPEVRRGGRTSVSSDIFTLGVALGTMMEAADLPKNMERLIEK